MSDTAPFRGHASDNKAPGSSDRVPVAVAVERPSRGSRSFVADHGALSVAVCALIIATASLPPVWARLNGLSDIVIAKVVPAISRAPDDAEPQATGSVTAQQADKLRVLLSGQSAPFIAMPSGPAAPARTASQIPVADGRDVSVSDRIDALQQGLDATRKSVEGLGQAVEHMRISERKLALTLVLQSAMRDGRPFLVELEWLRRTTSDDVTAAAVDVLIPYARRGVATIADLRDVLFQTEFSEAVRRAALRETSYLDRIQRSVGSWIAEFGMAQQPKPLDVDAILEEARIAIARGQIAEAVAAVQRLEGPPSTLLAPWVTRAKVRLLIDEMVQRLLQSTAGPG